MQSPGQEGFKHCVPPSRVVDLFRLPKSLQSDIDIPQEKDGTPKAFKERINVSYLSQSEQSNSPSYISSLTAFIDPTFSLLHPVANTHLFHNANAAKRVISDRISSMSDRKKSGGSSGSVKARIIAATLHT